jgi:LuxR family maltose regulon positive regulatory protein
LYEGDLEGAAGAVQSAVERVPAQAPDYVRQEVASHQVRVYLAQDRLRAAELLLQAHGFSFQDSLSFPALPPEHGISFSTGLLYNSGLRVLLRRARRGDDRVELASGIDLATLLIDRAARGQQLLLALDARLLRAQMHALLGNHLSSRADYARALEQAEPERFVALFVEHGRPVADALAQMLERDQLGAVRPEYVERILAAFPGPQPPDACPEEPVALVEPLTDRELEVLSWMAKGHTYKEVAAQLTISLNTVRFHVKAIYGKLNVNNRTQAVERARQLRLL